MAAPSARKSPRWALALLYAALGAPATLLAALTYLNSQNILHNAPHWQSGKLALEQATLGAASALVRRVTLFRNHLDLGAFFGFQQFLRTEPDPIQEIRFRYRLPVPTYVDVLFGASREELSGVRLSRHPGFASRSYRVDGSGRFVTTEGFRGSIVADSAGWQDASIAFGRDGATLRGAADRQARIAGDFSGVRTIGFRGGQHSSLVDDLGISFANERAPIHDSFANRRDFWAVLAICGAGLALLAAAAFRLFRTRLAAWESHMACLTALFVTTIGIGAYSALDFFHLAGLYPADAHRIDFKGYRNRIPTASEVTGRLRKEAADLRATSDLKVMLIGTSQTRGSGARRTPERIDRVLQERLDEARPFGRPVRVINAAIGAVRSDFLLDFYRREWVELAPDLVVINLSNNDRAGPAFERNLAEFARINRARGIPTLFVLEPNATDGRTGIRAKHAIVTRVAENTGWPVLDMHRELFERREEGFLWWDYVHLTSFGQRLFAERLQHDIVATLRDASPPEATP